MDSALLAGVALDSGRLVDYAQLVTVGCYAEVVTGDDTDDGEERTGWFPALGTAAGVVVRDVALYGDLDFVLWAVAVEVSAGEVGVAFGDSVVDEGVNGRHFDG